MDGGQIGLVGGLIGGVLGILGAAVGTYFSIKRTLGPRERTFMVRVSVVAWLIISAFLAGMLLLPKPYNWLLWIPYGIGLPLSIVWLNRRQAQIRSAEGGSNHLSRSGHS
jgi:low temperature requirement protein LtrA